ncbi:MAG: hypothetical protein M0Z53_16550 [Thermaerobacter sp.]|nr:hypothetical protein [Thermaerobacter sp.]
MWTPDQQSQATASRAYRVREFRRRVANYESDYQQAQRLRARQCRACYYLDAGLAGQAFTAYTCQQCEQPRMHHNTHIPTLCDACADVLRACGHCGGDREPTPSI